MTARLLDQIRGWCPSLFEPMTSGDGLLARIKPPLGRLDAPAARALAAAARRFGNGQLELTNRGALQVRGLSEATLPPFREAALAAGLASADPVVERRRNVIVSPAASEAGLALAAELERWIAEDETLAALPAKFGFAVGARLPGDIRITAEAERPLRLATRATSPAGGGGSGPKMLQRLRGSCRAATEGAFWRIDLGGGVAGLTADPLAAIRTVTRNFLRLCADHPDAPRRLADLPATALLLGADVTLIDTGATPTAAPVAGSFGDGFALGVAFGAFTPEQLDAAAVLAERFADGLVRLSPWRAFVLRPVSNSATLAAAGDAAGFVVDPADPRLRVSACAGAPGCASAHAATRLDAATVATRRPAGHVHLSGCAKGCAHPAPADVTLVAGPDGYGLVRGGRAGDPPEPRGLTLQQALLAAEFP